LIALEGGVLFCGAMLVRSIAPSVFSVGCSGLRARRVCLFTDARTGCKRRANVQGEIATTQLRHEDADV
jgi:hypothetical protein